MALQSHCLCQGFFSSFTLSIKAGSLFFTSHSSFSFVVPLFWLLLFISSQAPTPLYYSLLLFIFYACFYCLFMLLDLIIHFCYLLLLHVFVDSFNCLLLFFTFGTHFGCLLLMFSLVVHLFTLVT